MNDRASRGIRRIWVVLIALAILALGLPAQTASADIVGNWEFTLATDQGDMTAQATFAKAADGAYTCEWTPVWPEDMQNAGMFDPSSFEITVSDVALDGQKLTFLQSVSMGQEFEMVSEFTGTVDGDAISGTFASDFMTFAATAVRVASEAQSAGPAFWQWAQTPPMGWNSWDCYGPTVREDEVKANADYMAEHLAAHGWEYIVVDIRWFVENTKAGGYNQTDPIYVMDEYGRFMPAVNRFPSAADGQGFKPLADYVHSKGLKFGIHIMRGIPVEAVNRNTPILGSDARAADIYSQRQQCTWLRDMYTIVADQPGAQEYYNSIFALYASWGVDYIKIDDLSSPYHADEIELIRKAIDGCGRPIVLSMSPGATPLSSAEHAVQHANLWRISGDFWDRWQDIRSMFGRCRNWAPFSGPGHWPDADMLPLGRISIRGERGPDRRSQFTKDEAVTLMTLWSIFRSPLMFGGDLPSNDEFTLSLITNDEVLAVNQTCTNSREVSNAERLIVWAADIPNSPDKYVALFNANEGDQAAEVGVDLTALGLEGQCEVRDLWAGENVGQAEGRFAASVSPHGAGLYRISPR